MSVPASAAAQSSEQRAHPRVAVHRAGKLLCNGAPVLDCTILNISSGGAKVQITGRSSHPASELVLIDLETGVAHKCDVMWRKARTLGLRYQRSQALRGLVAADFQEAKRVWSGR